MTDARSAQAPVFVIGTPRSGTTLTASIIGQHSQVFMPGENHYFELIAPADPLVQWPAEEAQAATRDLLAVYGRYNQVEDQARVERNFADAERINKLENAASPAALFDEFMALQSADAGKPRWGNQAPKDIFSVHKILASFPDARFVVCVRDARDFLLSYKGRWEVSDHADRLRALYHPMLTAMLWRTTMRQIAEVQLKAPEGHVCIVRYEDLVTESEKTVRRVCETLGIAFEAGMLEGLGNNSSTGTTQEGIFSTSIGRWREGLTPAEVWAAQRIAGNLLQEFGYERLATAGDLLRRVGIVLTFPFGVLRALWANREHRGPLLPYIWRRGKQLITSSA